MEVNMVLEIENKKINNDIQLENQISLEREIGRASCRERV